MTDQERTENVHTKSKWYVNNILDKESKRIPENNGYFGAYTIITLDGKKNVVYVDDRNSDCVVQFAEWFDDVFGEIFDGDTRWNNGGGIMFVRNGDKYNAIGRGTQYFSKTQRFAEVNSSVWYDSIDPKKCYTQRGEVGYCGTYYNATLNGKNVRIDRDGVLIADNIQSLMQEVADWSKAEIMEKWIEHGRPCAEINGYAYRGARHHAIDNKKAAELLPISSDDRKGVNYNTYEWDVLNGQLTLVFNRYSENDLL
jgi:hypothetical protein